MGNEPTAGFRGAPEEEGNPYIGVAIRLAFSLGFGYLYLTGVQEQGDCWAVKSADGWYGTNVDPNTPANVVNNLPPDTIELKIKDIGANLQGYCMMSLILVIIGILPNLPIFCNKENSPEGLMSKLPFLGIIFLAWGLAGIWQFFWTLSLGFSGAAAACQSYLPASYLAVTISFWFIWAILALGCLGCCAAAYMMSRAKPTDGFR